MSNIISLKDYKENKEVEDLFENLFKDTTSNDGPDLEEIAKRNKRKTEEMKAQRKINNKSVLRSYRITPKGE